MLAISYTFQQDKWRRRKKGQTRSSICLLRREQSDVMDADPVFILPKCIYTSMMPFEMYRMTIRRFYLHECNKDDFYLSKRDNPKAEFNMRLSRQFLLLPEEYHKRLVTFKRYFTFWIIFFRTIHG